MELIKQDVYVINIEEGRYWAEYPDDEENGFWLKLIKGVYVLDLEKLEAIKKGSYNKGWSDCLKKYDPKNKQYGKMEGDK